MPERFSYRHWRDFQHALTLVGSVGFGVGALWWMLVLGICTALESYRFQEEAALAGSALVLLAGTVALVRSFLSMPRTVIEVSPQGLKVIRPSYDDCTFAHAELQSVKFKREQIGGFHRVVDTRRVIEITTVAGQSLSVDIHHSWWGGLRKSLAKYLPSDRLGPLG